MGGRDRRIEGPLWSTSLTKAMSLRFNERPCLKRWRIDRRYQMSSALYMYAAHISTHTYTHIYTYHTNTNHTHHTHIHTSHTYTYKHTHIYRSHIHMSHIQITHIIYTHTHTYHTHTHNEFYRRALSKVVQ